MNESGADFFPNKLSIDQNFEGHKWVFYLSSTHINYFSLSVMYTDIVLCSFLNCNGP